ncbi:PAS domain-containing hybrid sensor histidine kinase/response regulator [Sphingomicrobium aestuariivivum]|uniref:PAS domain-containing hybrid sensor histidine kinase/response regulator n=1 Tax=Sphingomicrobium aestuariivivum TaxID=1582356 RepID=UPI001FD6CD04|nr:PAS domain-containing hybrid sensor histidine kinase/response regulator [Sphingomicrobium aestuariivivum]MCJ8190768.1 ATP-binding protein [Sphingomicrobium aestuariivivum]
MHGWKNMAAVLAIGLAYLVARLMGLGLVATACFVTLLLFFALRQAQAARSASAQTDRLTQLAEHRARAIDELNEANHLLLMTEATAHVGHWLIDLEEKELYWSDETCRIHGVEPGHVPTLDEALDVYHPDDREAVAELVEDALAGGRDYRFTARMVRADGEVRTVESIAKVDKDETGKPTQLFGVFRDRTDELEQQKELKKALHAAKHAAAAKSHFLANMSHEIRTPMNGVLGFTELLLAEPLTEKQHRHVQLIHDSGTSMLQLLNDILDISKIEAGRLELLHEPVDLRAKIHACVDIMRAAAEAKGLELEVDCDPAIPDFMEGDRLRVRQILLNLLGNAVKFTEKGSIRVAARRCGGDDGPRVEIAVIDSGIGIPEGKQKQIFDTFDQGASTTARDFGGSGLGLAISRRLADAMGGRLKVESAQGEGSTFTIDLPLVERASPHGVTPMRAARDEQFGDARLLVVEDNEVNQMLATAMCEQLGVACDLAADGLEAVDAIEQAAREGRPYGLVLMDLQMPHLGGIDATKRLRRLGHGAESLPIIALTANAFAEDVEECLAAGMQAHLTKPVKLEQLQAMIAQHLSPTPSPGARVAVGS